MDNLDNIHILELKEAFDEFDKVLCERITINDFEYDVRMAVAPSLQESSSSL